MYDVLTPPAASWWLSPLVCFFGLLEVVLGVRAFALLFLHAATSVFGILRRLLRHLRHVLSILGTSLLICEPHMAMQMSAMMIFRLIVRLIALLRRTRSLLCRRLHLPPWQSA